jgi:dipeptidyl aminopeptidase/acylaminoacyl peptidase
MLLGLLAPRLAAQAEEAPDPLAVEDVLRTRTFTTRIPMDVSPDSRWIAFTLEDPSRQQIGRERRYRYHTRTGATIDVGACDVCVVHTETGESRNLTGGRGTSWGPVWSPDGHRLAFYSDRDGRARLWVWEASSGHLRAVSDVIVRPLFNFESPRWTPDGRKVLVKVLPDRLTLEEAADLEEGKRPEVVDPGGSTAVVLRSPARPAGLESTTVWTSASQADLALIDLESGMAERLARGVRPRTYWFASDGSRVAFTTYRGDEAEGSQQQLYDLHVRSLGDGATRTVATGLRLDYGTSVSFAPDASGLAILTGGPKGRGDCLVVPVDGGKPVNLSGEEHPDLSHPYRAPLWDAEGRSIYIVGDGDLWKIAVAAGSLARLTRGDGPRIVEVIAAGPGRIWSPDNGRSAIVVTRDESTKQVGFNRVDLQTGRRIPLLAEDKSYGNSDNLPFSMRVAGDGSRIFFVAEDAQHPPDLWVSQVDFRKPRRLSRINPHLDRYRFGASRLVEWRGIDGTVLRGALLLPSDYREGRRCPLVVKVYGGESMSNQVNRFGAEPGVDNLQLLATRGYAVLLPDTILHPGRVARDLAEAVMAGVDKIVELGIADPARLGVMGHSFGGYSVAALITQTTRFRAAVASGGTYDLISGYGQMDRDGDAQGVGSCEEGQFLLGGPPWEFPLRYLENSPIFHLDRVSTPLLIVHGALDDTFPVAQSDELFVGLRRLGKEAVYARYEGEAHHQGSWGHANAVDCWNRVLEWFDKHIGPKARPVVDRAEDR